MECLIRHSCTPRQKVFAKDEVHELQADKTRPRPEGPREIGKGMEVQIVYEIGRDICRDLSEDESISIHPRPLRSARLTIPPATNTNMVGSYARNFGKARSLSSVLPSQETDMLQPLLRRISSYGLPASSASD